MSLQKLNRLEPALKDYLWGGTLLKEHYSKSTDLSIVAESWELSTHPDGISRINGESLLEYVQKHPEVLGTSCHTEDIPLLIKFIDARQKLSIQVHPDDEYARRVEHDNGKTEMWYLIDATPDAYLYLGVNRVLSKEEFRRHIEDNTILEVLNKVPVRKGECYLVRAGTIHAIGEGCLIMEIQERSNVTYRVYDYARRGKDGQLRPLHIEKSIEVANLNPVTITSAADQLLQDNDAARVELLKKTEYFHVYDYQVHQEAQADVDGESFWAFMNVQGTAEISCGDEHAELKQGESLFVPAGAGKVAIRGACEVIGARL